MKKETPIDEIEQLAKEAGGVFFISILDKDCVGNEKPVVIRDDGSPVFYFNIENPAGFSMLLECEKALTDQNMVQFMKNVFWFGEPITRVNVRYARSTDLRSAPATQQQLIDRVNDTIDKCLKYMTMSITEDRRVYLSASNRMNYYVNKTDFGAFIKSQYPVFPGGKLENEIM